MSIPAWRANAESKASLTNSANLIWSVAEILRGDFKQSEYQKVVLPFTVLRRLDAVLTPKKKDVAFRPVSLDTVIKQEDANAEVLRLILPEGRMRELIIDYVARNVYDQARTRL